MLFCATSLRHTCLSERHGHEASSPAVPQSRSHQHQCSSSFDIATTVSPFWQKLWKLIDASPLATNAPSRLGHCFLRSGHEAHAFTSVLDSMTRVRVGVGLTRGVFGKNILRLASIARKSTGLSVWPAYIDSKMASHSLDVKTDRSCARHHENLQIQGCLSQSTNPLEHMHVFRPRDPSTQTPSISRWLLIQSLHTSRNLNHRVFSPYVNRPRHHLLRQTGQTSSPNTNTSNTVTSMHQSRTTVTAKVASHSPP
jgi:hypothetical protein